MNRILSMCSLLCTLGCNIGGNSPPRFQTFNEEKVKYLFGIAYLQSSIFQGISVEPNTRWNFELEISDVNGDDVEILFPSAPGVMEFNQDTRTGYWDIPAEVVNYYPTIQVLAVDEHGASDVLFLNLEIYQEWDSGSWDSGLWDTGWWEEPNYGGGSILTGDINIENGFVGNIEYKNPFSRCRITWRQVEGQSVDNCDWCERTWAFTLRNGTMETRPESCRDIQSTLESIDWRIGWAQTAIWNDFSYENTVFLDHPTAGWSPLGEGTLRGHRFNFTMQTP